MVPCTRIFYNFTGDDKYFRRSGVSNIFRHITENIEKNLVK